MVTQSGNIQLQIEYLWDRYDNAELTPQERAFIWAELERLYSILRGESDLVSVE